MQGCALRGMKKDKQDKMRAYCRRCRHDQVFLRAQMHHGVHLLFSVLTLGLWSVSWLSIYLGHRFRPWRCEHCGWHKPESRHCEAKVAVSDKHAVGTAGGRGL